MVDRANEIVLITSPSATRVRFSDKLKGLNNSSEKLTSCPREPSVDHKDTCLRCRERNSAGRQQPKGSMIFLPEQSAARPRARAPAQPCSALLGPEWKKCCVIAASAALYTDQPEADNYKLYHVSGKERKGRTRTFGPDALRPTPTLGTGDVQRP